MEIPAADSLVNVNLTCSGAGEGEATSPPCSEGSLCLEGDVGVYCQCYMSKSTGNEVITYTTHCGMATRPRSGFVFKKTIVTQGAVSYKFSILDC